MSTKTNRAASPAASLIERDQHDGRALRPTRCPVANTEERKDDPLSELVHVQLCDATGNPVGYPQWLSRRVVHDKNSQAPRGMAYREIA